MPTSHDQLMIHSRAGWIKANPKCFMWFKHLHYSDDYCQSVWMFLGRFFTKDKHTVLNKSQYTHCYSVISETDHFCFIIKGACSACGLVSHTFLTNAWRESNQQWKINQTYRASACSVIQWLTPNPDMHHLYAGVQIFWKKKSWWILKTIEMRVQIHVRSY